MERDLEQLGRWLDALGCGAAVIDASGRLVAINTRLTEMAERPRDALLNRPVFELFDAGADRDRLARMTLNLELPSQREFALRQWSHRPSSEDGGAEPTDTLPVLVTVGRVGQTSSQTDPRILTVIDISEQKEAFHEVARLGDTVLEQAVDLTHANQHLEDRVARRTADLHAANMDAIYMLAVASEARDDDTGQHLRRIQHYSVAVARQMGLSAAEAQRVGYSAILHDVGKIHLPDYILKKPGPLSSEERREMQGHTLVGQAMLLDKPFFSLARQIARGHHENFDGSGYPDHLRGEAIPLAARIVHVVDVFDALSSRRVYKKAWPWEESALAVADGAGVQFDPEAAAAFMQLHRRGCIAEIHHHVSAQTDPVDEGAGRATSG